MRADSMLSFLHAPSRSPSSDPGDEVFVFAGVHVAMLELDPIPTEAMPDELLQGPVGQVIDALERIPERDPAPWVLQFFVSDDFDLTPAAAEIAGHIRTSHAADPARGEDILASKFTQTLLSETALHAAGVSRPEGAFEDTEVSGTAWRGRRRRVRCVIYRRQGPAIAQDAPSRREEVDAVAGVLVAGLRAAGAGTRRCNGRDFDEWLAPWLDGHAHPDPDPELGAWSFDGTLIRALTLQKLDNPPDIGHFTAERDFAGRRVARLDLLPPGSMLSITVTIKAQHLVREHVERVQRASTGRTDEAQAARDECRQVLQHMATGEKLFPTFVTLYLAGKSQEDLRKKIVAVTAQLRPGGLRFIPPEHDLTPLDAFVQGLPMGFDPVFDAKHMRRSRLIFAPHIAAMLPVYGRHRGTGHPGVSLWNRGGEPLWIDPLDSRDRLGNAHLFMLGGAGSGSRVLLRQLVLSAMAVHRPRLVIADVGESFEPLVRFFGEMGLSTRVVKIQAQAGVSLPPFARAQRLLDDPEVMAALCAAEKAGAAETGEAGDTLVPAIDRGGESSPDARLDDEISILGEMLLSALMMIAGGEPKELDELGRADRYLIVRAIILAAQAARLEGRPHPRALVVAERLIEMRRESGLSPKRQERAADMGQSMLAFTRGLRGRLFDRYEAPWPDADVTLVEMGTLAKDGCEDALALAYAGLIDQVQALGEATQHDGRPTLFLTGEGHLVARHPLLGRRIALSTKRWRMLQVWFWFAAENVSDLPDEMRLVLSMCEWWWLLTIHESEIGEIARFRTLTRTQRLMVEAVRQEPGKYTEGVLLSARQQLLFRSVPPPLALALVGSPSCHALRYSPWATDVVPSGPRRPGGLMARGSGAVDDNKAIGSQAAGGATGAEAEAA